MKRRLEICRQLLHKLQDDEFWKRIVTSNEKWIHLVNHNRQKRWVPKDQALPQIPHQECFGKKLCCAFGGTLKEYFILNLCQMVTLLMPSSTVSSWNGSMSN